MPPNRHLPFGLYMDDVSSFGYTTITPTLLPMQDKILALGETES